MIVSASVPYTCGELFQGTLDGEPCLVSCPITLSSTARIGWETFSAPANDRSTAGVAAALPRKAARALAALGIAPGETPPIELERGLPHGRGYGTSTADIGAVLFAAALATGRHLGTADAAAIAVGIEPTDSTFFPGLSLFDHRSGGRQAALGDPPAAAMVVIDPGGSVDSEGFNAHDWRPALSRLARQHREAFDLLALGVGRGDLDVIGAAATLSARAHQAILPSPWLEPALSLAAELGAAGVCRAHSGTVLGLLFAPDGFHPATTIARVRARLPGRVGVRLTTLAGGGPQLVMQAPETEPELVA